MTGIADIGSVPVAWLRNGAKLAMELIIKISNMVTILPNPEAPILFPFEKFPTLFSIEDELVKTVIRASTIITTAEIPRKNKNTFLAMASLKVDLVITQMFFNCSPLSPIFQ